MVVFQLFCSLLMSLMHKKSASVLAEEYELISITLFLSKIFERLLAKRFNNFFIVMILYILIGLFLGKG